MRQRGRSSSASAIIASTSSIRATSTLRIDSLDVAESGGARYEGARWRQFVTGAWGLEDALAVVDCAVEEIIERHSHGIMIGAVKWVHLGGGREALVYGHGSYSALNLGRSRAL